MVFFVLGQVMTTVQGAALFGFSTRLSWFPDVRPD